MRKASTLLVSLLISIPAVVMAQDVVSICSEPGDGPPWLYWMTKPGANAPGQLAGFSVDMLQSAFSKFGKSIRIQGDAPWPRCLKLVENRQIDFATGAYFSEERAQKYDFSQPYKTLTPQVFVRKDSSVNIQTIADLQRFKGCGMSGSSYAHYGLTRDQLYQGARSYDSLIKMLKAKRCDFFVEELEVIAQLNAGRDHFLDDPLMRHNAIAGAQAPAMHIIAAKGSPEAALLPQFNDAILKMQRSGEFLKLWKKNAGNIPF
jgi:polar amino acid transport system substrate-binding protein